MDQEMLHAISDLLDQKLVPVHESLGALEKGQTELRDRFDGLETRFDGLETRFDGLETRFDGLETRFDGLETRFDGLETRFDGLEAKVDRLDERVTGIELTLENDIKPNIKILAEGVMQNTERIERIEKKLEKLDGIEANVDILMTAVRSHSYDIDMLKAVK